MSKESARDRGASATGRHRAGSDAPFFLVFAGLGGSYVLLIVLMLAADLVFTSPRHFLAALTKPEIQYAVRLTLISCTISACLSLLVATPLGYLLSRHTCLLYTSPSPRDGLLSRMPSSA